ncbi:zinc finger transcription factor YRR1 [Kluyveromyces marxianus]|nr:zinc finger transcription factor YRR1 [Kluyveromyces marxianus]
MSSKVDKKEGQGGCCDGIERAMRPNNTPDGAKDMENPGHDGYSGAESGNGNEKGQDEAHGHGNGNGNGNKSHSNEARVKKSNPKRRRKLIRSCTFCRKRKLKCDRARPMCTGCRMRGLSECVYTDGLNQQTSPDGRFSGAPNEELLQEIARLKSIMHENEEYSLQRTSAPARAISYGVQSKEKNPLSEYTYVMIKRERTVRYGCTSFRTIAKLSGGSVAKYLREVAGIHKNERGRIKARTGNSMLYELQRIERPWSLGMLISELPKYSELCATVEHAFNYKGFRLHKIFSKDRVRRYLNECFKVRDDRIIELIPHAKLNYYPIGIVLHLYITLMEDAPASFISFFLMLLGQTTAKIYYVERVQFILLHYIWKAGRFQNGGDNSHLAPLVELMVSSALDIGLHDCAGELLQDRKLLNSMWLWILFYDIVVSFDMGRSVLVSGELFDSEKLLNDQEFQVPVDGVNDEFGPAFMLSLRKFVYYGRITIIGLYSRNKIPDLDLYINHFEKLIDEIWPSKRDFFEDTNTMLNHLSFAGSVICLPATNIVSTLRALKRLVFKDYSTENYMMNAKMLLMSVDLIYGSIIECYHSDLQEAPEELASPLTTPSNIRCVIEVISSHWVRSIFLCYQFLFTLAMNLNNSSDIEGASSSIQDTTVLENLLNKFNKAHQICFDQLRSSPALLPLHQYLSSRHPFIHMLFYERTARMMLGKLTNSKVTEDLQTDNEASNSKNDFQENPGTFALTDAYFPPLDQTDIENIFNEMFRDSGISEQDMVEISSANTTNASCSTNNNSSSNTNNAD